MYHCLCELGAPSSRSGLNFGRIDQTCEAGSPHRHRIRDLLQRPRKYARSDKSDTPAKGKWQE
jgi:hypothetical protein